LHSIDNLIGAKQKIVLGRKAKYFDLEEEKLIKRKKKNPLKMI